MKGRKHMGVRGTQVGNHIVWGQDEEQPLVEEPEYQAPVGPPPEDPEDMVTQFQPEIDPTVPSGNDVAVEPVTIEMPEPPGGFPPIEDLAPGEIPQLPAPAELPPPPEPVVVKQPGKKPVKVVVPVKVKIAKIKIKTDKWFISEAGVTVCIHKDKKKKQWTVRAKVGAEDHAFLKNNYVTVCKAKNENDAYELAHKVTSAMVPAVVLKKKHERKKRFQLNIKLPPMPKMPAMPKVKMPAMPKVKMPKLW